MMLFNETRMTNDAIYELIKSNNLLTKVPSSDFVYIIDGNNGPTGKSWLVRKLLEDGYRAIDISEEPFERQYKITNYIGIDDETKIVRIILNRPLNRG